MTPWMRVYRTPAGYREIRGGAFNYQFGYIPALWAFVLWSNSDYEALVGATRWQRAWKIA